MKFGEEKSDDRVLVSHALVMPIIMGVGSMRFVEPDHTQHCTIMGVAKLEAFGSQAFLLPLNHTPPRSVSDNYTRRIGKVTLITFLLLVILGYTHWDCVAQYLPYTKLRNPAYLIKAHHGAVASENKRCSDIGVDALKEGGNAVDAAIATAFCTGVVNMFSYAWMRLPNRNGCS